MWTIPPKGEDTSFQWRPLSHDHPSSKDFCAKQSLAGQESPRLREQSLGRGEVLAGEQPRPPPIRSGKLREAAHGLPQLRIDLPAAFPRQRKCRRRPGQFSPSTLPRGAGAWGGDTHVHLCSHRHTCLHSPHVCTCIHMHTCTYAYKHTHTCQEPR